MFEKRLTHLKAYCQRRGCYPPLAHFEVSASAGQSVGLKFQGMEAEELQKLDSILANDATLAPAEKYELRATNALLLGSVKRASQGFKLEAGVRLGALLKRARTAKGLTVMDVCDQVPLDIATYARLENGAWVESLPSDIAQALAVTLGLEVSDLVRAGEMDLSEPVKVYSAKSEPTSALQGDAIDLQGIIAC